jgi:hypothetical protein
MLFLLLMLFLWVTLLLLLLSLVLIGRARKGSLEEVGRKDGRKAASVPPEGGPEAGMSARVLRVCSRRASVARSEVVRSAISCSFSSFCLRRWSS